MLTPSNSSTEENCMNLFNSIWDRRTRSAFALSALTFGLVGAASIGASEAATDDRDVLKTTVRYAPSELATDSGAQALYRRLTMAADHVCPNFPSSSKFVSVEVRRCREHAVRQAVLQIDNPRLTGVLAAMTPVQVSRSETHSMEHGSRRIRTVDSGG
jgi:UrcA family protein